MKQIETIKSGKNYSAVSVGKMSEIIEHVLPMGPNVTIQGKVFAGRRCYRKRVLVPDTRSRSGQWFLAYPQDS